MKVVNFKPMNNYVVFEIPQIKDKTDSGLIKTPEQIEREKKEVDVDDPYTLVVGVSNNLDEPKLGSRIMINAERMNIIPIEGVDYGIIDAGGILGYEDIHNTEK